jgi:SOS response regulatory protein OraA/RecX
MRPQTGTERLEARRARRERHAAETDQAVVLKAAARFLELRSRSVGEVRRHLLAAAFPEPLIEDAIARLLELGMLDDRAFAQAWVESRDRAWPSEARLPAATIATATAPRAAPGRPAMPTNLPRNGC